MGKVTFDELVTIKERFMEVLVVYLSHAEASLLRHDSDFKFVF